MVAVVDTTNEMAFLFPTSGKKLTTDPKPANFAQLGGSFKGDLLRI